MQNNRPDVDRLLEYSDWLARESRRLAEEGAAQSDRLAGLLEHSLEEQGWADEAQLNSSLPIAPTTRPNPAGNEAGGPGRVP